MPVQQLSVVTALCGMDQITQVPVVIAVVPFFRVSFIGQHIGAYLLGAIHYADLSVIVVVCSFIIIANAIIAGISRAIGSIVIRLLRVRFTQAKQRQQQD